MNACCQLATTFLLANTLPTTTWGAIAVIISYVLVMETLLSTKNWQLVSSHAFPFLDKSTRRFSAHFSAFAATEIISNAIATGLALALLPIAFFALNLPSEFLWAGSIYSLSILFRFSGSAGAILRLTNHFVWQSWHAGTLGLARLLAIGLVLTRTDSPTAILACLAAIESIWHLGLTASALFVLKKKGVTFHSLRRHITGRLKHQNWKLVATSHFTNLVKVAGREIDILVLSALTGPETAGIVKVYKSILRAILIVSDPLSNASFPRFIRLQGLENSLRETLVLVRTLTVSGAGLASLALTSLVVLIALFWEHYSDIPIPTANGYFQTYAAGIWVAVAFFCLPPANLALKRYGFALRLNCALTIIQLTFLLTLVPIYGATGAGIAFAVTQILWAASYILSLKKESSGQLA